MNWNMASGIPISNLCRCMDGPNYPDPNCVRCHGTGEPVPSYSVIMLARPNRTAMPYPFRWTNAGAHAAVRTSTLFRANSVVNVYPKRKPDILASMVGPDDANVAQGAE